MLNGIFRKPRYAQIKGRKDENVDNKPKIPAGMWIKCKACKGSIYHQDIKKNHGICPTCNYHFPLAARSRIHQILDRGSWKELDKDMESVNPLGFDSYNRKLEKAKDISKQNEAVLTGVGKINKIKLVIGVMDSRFMMGSMGSVVGEKISRAIEYATEHRLPLILFTASGGARMQEGIFSLMQMAKTSAALARHDDNGLLYITVLTNPTTGGVTASFAMLGDIIIAEPGALVGFAGPRVIEQTIKQKLPRGFQQSEFLQEHGMIDMIVERRELRDKLSSLLLLHQPKEGDIDV
ncbi:MAG: acetyl-CoA carboxylase carboxyltransferase subunit beta [Epulopiscium sp.]|nr:acetyl-CoA carboxylase carboxyltransferase subunit beta [Candidatus Epulonipiscium sp.]